MVIVMATIEKRIGKNKEVTYRITVADGIDGSGKQIRHRLNWKPPRENMTDKQIEKALNRAVADFEREIEIGYRLDRKQTFAEYAEYVLRLKERTGVKYRTIERYESLLQRVNTAIGHLKLADIKPQHLNAFYENLGEEGIRIDQGKATAAVDIKAWRKSKGITAVAFAEAVNVAESTLRLAESGESVSEETAGRIAQGMGKSAKEVFALAKNKKPLSNKTILEHHRLISTILAQAEKELLIPFNPAAKATPPKTTQSSPDYFQPETVKLILEALDDEPLKWRAATYLLIDTGCRRGEAAGLKWDCVDLTDENNAIVTFERALLYSPKKGVYESSTKTGKSRTVGIAPETAALLKAWRDVQNGYREAHGDAWVDSGYVFSRDNGAPINPDSLTDWLNKFSARNGLPHIHPHAFRHTAASMMIANGIDVVTTANELGHASAATTTSIYAHQIAQAKARAGNVRAGLLKRQ